jgi:hypothetical protein
MSRVLYAASRDRALRARAASAVRSVCRSVRRRLQSAGAAGRGQSIPRCAVQRQRAQVHAGHAWPAERSGQLRGPATFHHRFAVGGGAAVGTAARGGAHAPRHPRPRRHELSQTGDAFGRRAAAVLRRAGQGGQLPSGGVDRAARRPARVAAQFRVVSPEGLGHRRDPPGQGPGARACASARSGASR